MATSTPLSREQLMLQVRTHLVYELKWMIFAADAFRNAEGWSYVAFLDSAALHARNLFEFAAKQDEARFTLHALGGNAAKSNDWDRWVNNRVAHMLEREHDKAPWPAGGGEGWEDPNKLMTMAKEVLERLRAGGKCMPQGLLRDSYYEVLSAAEQYWADPNPKNHGRLARLYDESQDEPYPD